jgi:tetratricopeptide (TPR) repeat protein
LEYCLLVCSNLEFYLDVFSGRMIGNLASIYCALGDKEQAVLHLELTLQFFRQNLPNSHPDTGNFTFYLHARAYLARLLNPFLTVTAMSNLASSYASYGRHREAAALREEIHKLRQRLLPEEHPDAGQ